MHLYDFFFSSSCLRTFELDCLLLLCCFVYAVRALAGWFHGAACALAALDLLGSEAVGSCCNTALLSSQTPNLPLCPTEHYHTHQAPGTGIMARMHNLPGATAATNTHTGLHATFYTPPHLCAHLGQCRAASELYSALNKTQKSPAWSCFISPSPGPQTAHNLTKPNQSKQNHHKGTSKRQQLNRVRPQSWFSIRTQRTQGVIKLFESEASFHPVSSRHRSDTRAAEGALYQTQHRSGCHRLRGTVKGQPQCEPFVLTGTHFSLLYALTH